MKYKLGIKVKDAVTNMQGILMSRSENLNGCTRYYIQPPVKKDGDLPDGTWVDEMQIKVLSDKSVVQDGGNDTGSPMSKIR